MCARLLAAFCLLTTLVTGGRAASSDAADSRLVVYLGVAPGQPAAPVEQMKRELGAIMGRAGFQVEWLTERAGRTKAPDAPFLAVVEMDGVCAADSRAVSNEPAQGGVLATTSVVEGHVLPFSTVACTALSRTLSPSIARQAGAMRDFLLGRAMARVVAHEMYHMLAGTREHTAAGIARSCYSVADLLTERFDFEPAILALLRSKVEVRTSADAVADEATGRN